MGRRVRATGIVLSVLGLAALLATAHSGASPGNEVKQPPHHTVLPSISEGNLTVFPVISSVSYKTRLLMTLDEGIRSGQVVVTETGSIRGLVRPRPSDRGVWRERPFPLPPDPPVAQVNQLSLINNSDHPLILLAGEIVVGGKQDRIVGKDRIIPAHSEPVALDVFCVEPHRWMGASARFDALDFSMAQPSIRFKAMADQNQQEVWNQVARSRSAFVAAAPPLDARAMQATSSYADVIQNGAAQRRIDSLAAPIARSYEKFFGELRSHNAVGAVVAVNNEIIWADVFASSELLERYWPKLLRSYAAEALSPGYSPAIARIPPSTQSAQQFLEILNAKHEDIETEPGVYRNTEIAGDTFDCFLLTSLLPDTGFTVHMAKMKR